MKRITYHVASPAATQASSLALRAGNITRGWVLIVSSLMLLVAPMMASAATAGLSGSSRVQVGQMFTVHLTVSDATNADTARFIGTFPSDLLEIQNVSNVSAFPNRSPGSSSSASGFNFGVFSLEDPVSGTARAGSLTFRALKTGTATISLVAGTRILSAGVDQLTGLGSLSINITQAAAPGEIPIAPTDRLVMSSATHPDSTAWYPSRDVDVSWIVNGPSPVATYVGFDQSPSGSAEQRIDPKTQAHFTASSDGVWYVHVIARYSATDSVRRDFRVQIDTKPPRAFSVVADYTDVTSDIPNSLRFAAIDDTSGIKQYDVYLNDTFLRSTDDNEISLGRLTPGKYYALVRASDMAGNMSEAATTFFILPPLDRVTPTRISQWALIGFFCLLLFFVGFFLGRRFFKKNRK